MSYKNNLQLQQLDLNGLKTLVEWAKAEGWNPGVFDAEIFFATDPGGFCGFYDNNELIAGGSIVSYNSDFGFMGFFIVRPDKRGDGIGRNLWYQRRDKLISRLKPGASIGMDGVVAMQPFYHKGGFNLAFRDVRHERTGSAFIVDDHVCPITGNDFASVMVYDRQCFGCDRSAFMKLWLKQPEVHTFKYMDDGVIKGFAILRRADKGHRICPLFADDELVAEALYKACLNAASGEPVYLDIPTVNEKAMALAAKYDAVPIFECGRMYYGKEPDYKREKIYGITNFELG